MGRYIDDILQPGEKVLYSVGEGAERFGTIASPLALRSRITAR
jgi:hypothetical protein